MHACILIIMGQGKKGCSSVSLCSNTTVFIKRRLSSSFWCVSSPKKIIGFCGLLFRCVGVCLSGEFLSPQLTVIVLLLGGVLRSVFVLN